VLVERAGTVADHPLLNLPNVDGYVLPQQVDAGLAPNAGAAKTDLLVGVDAMDGVTLGGPPDADAYALQVHQRYGRLADRFLAAFPARSNEEASASNERLAAAIAAWRTFTWARVHTKAGGKAYAYVFSRAPPWSKTAGHAADVPYVFGFPRTAFRVLPWRAKRDLALADEMQGYWTNFAKTGDPNGEGLPAWQPFGTAEAVLNFADSTHMDDVPYRTEFALVEADREELRRPVALSQ
jgi:para-nitrobenzyl esterase